MKLLTTNPKVIKGEKRGYKTYILHLAPSTLSGINVCPNASPECIRLCLNTAGRGGIFKHGETTNAIQRARLRRTDDFIFTRAAFMRDLVDDIRKGIAYAQKHDLIPVFRLNGTSDIAWEDIPTAKGHSIFAEFPHVQFYDYTKNLGRLVKNRLPNYHLTFSRSEINQNAVNIALNKGFNVAVVFDMLPNHYLGRPVIDGDTSDLRFLDKVPNTESAIVVGLKAKGLARKGNSPFVVRKQEISK